jgi:putative OPT family oligopeptide transporter
MKQKGGAMAENNEAKNLNQKNQFEPYVKPTQKMAEVTLQAIILGVLLSIVFGVANAYLGLKVGMTVSASIPAAVISMAVLRGVLKRGTVLENNIVQTLGSTGESLAAGVIFTIPAFFIWNQTISGFSHEISNLDIVFLSLLGGALGILFMIPLRRYLVEREHGKLRFPEGTACAEIIKAGDEGGGKAKTVFLGLGLSALYKLLLSGFRLWPENPNTDIKFFKGANIGIDATPALLGVGYIIGPRIAALMMGGAVLGYLGIAPLIAYVGTHMPNIVPPADKLISEMNPAELRDNYIKYLGVGAVALGGFVSLIKSLPVIFHSFAVGIREVLGKKAGVEVAKSRLEQEIPMWVVLLGSLFVILLIWAYPGTELHLVGAALVVIFGFFFVVVAARIVGIVGSSSSPVSGMTIATLLVTSVILLSFGVSGFRGMVTVMSIGTVVCIAVCLSGDIAQDLKTGYLLGATPKQQQMMEFVGLLFPALVMGSTVFLLNTAFGFVRDAAHPTPLLAPQANVMAVIVQGVMTANLPWVPIIVGCMLAAAIELVGISSLPFAIGLYLPLNLSTPIMAGGLIALLVRKISKENVVKRREERGILFGSGLVAGDALLGVMVAFVIAFSGGYRAFYEAHEEMSLTGIYGPWISLLAFVLISYMLYRSTKIRGLSK